MAPFPEDIARFMYDNVESIDQLEILRVLGEDREREWDAASLAGEVQSEPATIEAHLAALHGRGLVTTSAGQSVSCRYGVRTPELENMVNRLLQMYRERPVTMIKMVYERARDPLRAFSEAFRIRKER